MFLLGVGQGLLAAAAGLVLEAGESLAVVAEDAFADGAFGHLDPEGQGRGGGPFEGAEDGLEASGDPGAGFGADEVSKFVGGVVGFDVHGGPPASGEAESLTEAGGERKAI